MFHHVLSCLPSTLRLCLPGDEIPLNGLQPGQLTWFFGKMQLWEVTFFNLCIEELVSRWIQTVGVLLPPLLACWGPDFVSLGKSCNVAGTGRTDDEVRVENLRKRYVPRKACLFSSYSFFCIWIIQLSYTRPVHTLNAWMRQGDCVVGIVMGRNADFYKVWCDRRIEHNGWVTQCGGWDPRAVSSISSNSRARVLRRFQGAFLVFGNLQTSRWNGATKRNRPVLEILGKVIHAAPRQGPPAPSLQGVICSSCSCSCSSSCCCCCCCGSWSNILGQKRPKKLYFARFLCLWKKKHWYLRQFCSVKDENCPKTSLFTLFFSERVENTVFCDVFSTRGFKCTANTTVFFMFSLPVLKANQPKTVVFTVFWQDNMQKKTMFWNNFSHFFSSCSSSKKSIIFCCVFATAHPDSRRR